MESTSGLSPSRQIRPGGKVSHSNAMMCVSADVDRGHMGIVETGHRKHMDTVETSYRGHMDIDETVIVGTWTLLKRVIISVSQSPSKMNTRKSWTLTTKTAGSSRTNVPSSTRPPEIVVGEHRFKNIFRLQNFNSESKFI